MKVFVVANNKGGVGKTTISKLFAEYCALHGKRVLLIDMDHQCSLSNRYLEMDLGPADKKDWIPPIHPDYNPEVQDVDNWNGRSSSPDIFTMGYAVPYPTKIENLEIIPGHSHNLLNVERVTQNNVYKDVLKIFKEWMYMDSMIESYDLCVIDTGPSKGPNTTAAIHSATHMLIPAEMEKQSIEGLYGMIALRTQENLSRSKETALQLVGVLPNKFKIARGRQSEFLDGIRSDERIGVYLLPVKLSDLTGYADDSLSESEGGTSVFKRVPSDRCRKEFEELAELLFGRIFDGEKPVRV